MKVLLRLLPYIQQHLWTFVFGISGLLIARIFEALIPQFVKLGIDNIASGQSALKLQQISLDQAAALLTYPALGISACVLAQMLVTVVSRIMIRRIGMYAAFDARNRVYGHLQLQGPIFYSRFSIGDLMGA